MKSLSKKAQGLMSSLATGTGAVNNSSVALFFLIMLFVHAGDFLTGFDRSSMAYLWAVIYIIAWALASFVFLRGEGMFTRETGIYFLVSAIQWFLPIIAGYINTLPIAIAEYYTTIILVFFPAWLIFLMANSHGSAILERVGRIYALIWVFIIIGLVLVNLAVPDIATAGVSNIGGNLQDFGDSVVNSWEGIIDTLTSGTQDIVAGINRSLNGHQYIGEVEDNEGETLGLYVKNVKPLSSEYYEGDVVDIYADLFGTTFLDPIYIFTDCYTVIDDMAHHGEVDPPGQIKISGIAQEVVRCSFDDLSKGTHKIILDTTYNFETWSYVPFFFVDRSTQDAFFRERLDINDELDIPEYVTSVYTNGPVSLGLSSELQQPIGVSVENMDRLPFGVTIANKEGIEGEVLRVHNFIILTPTFIELHACRGADLDDGWDWTEELTEEEVEGFNVHKFDSVDPGKTIQTVNCRMKVDLDRFNELLGTNQYLPVTFVSRARYDFLLSEDIRVRIKRIE